MTDEDLIAALGWEPCRQHPSWSVCDVHMGWPWVGATCGAMRSRLRDVRAGIDLAREGIVQAIATADPVAIHVADPGGYIREAVCEIALEWHARAGAVTRRDAGQST